MKRLFVVLVMAFAAIGTAVLAEPVSEILKWRGYIIDRQCAESVREDSDPVPFLRHHNKDCALMPSCRRNGYSLYASGKWLDLDKKANGLIMQALKLSKRKNGFYAEVAGKMQGKVVKVEKITEIEEPSQTGSGEER